MRDSRRLRIRVGPIFSTVEGPAPSRDLMEAFAVTRDRARGREGFPCFRSDGSFYTGLLPEVLAILRNQGIGVEQVDERVRPAVLRRWAQLSSTPRPYQRRVAEHLVEHPLTLARLPSAAGKSIAALAALERVGAGRALYLTDRLDLAFQFADVAREQLGIEPGFVGAGRFEVESPIVVASVDSALTRVDELGTFDLTIADEAHAAGAATYFDLVARVGSYYRLGLTATPFRSNRSEDTLLRALFGAPVEIVGLDELEAGGHVARPQLRMLPVPGPALDLTLVWRQLEEALVESPGRNRLIVQEALRLVEDVGSTLILVRLVRHGELLQELFREAGREVPFLTGKMPAAGRHGLLRAFREAPGGILIGTDVLSVGVDIPRLGGLVLACGQHARVGTLQKVGRVMRVSPGGGSCVRKVVDFDDAALHPLLGEHSVIRKRWMSEILGLQEEVDDAVERLHGAGRNDPL